MTYQEFEKKFCDHEQMPAEDFRAALRRQVQSIKPLGWFMLECQVLDSHRAGELVVLPFGGEATHEKVPPDTALISPRGLASDMSRVVGSCLVEDFPKEEQ